LLYCWKRSYRLDATKHRIITKQKVIGTCDDKYLLSVCPILIKIKLDNFDRWHLLLANFLTEPPQQKSEKKNSKFWATWDTLRLFAWSESWSYEWWEDLKRWTLSRKVSYRDRD
jgi:hypothetical protein